MLRISLYDGKHPDDVCDHCRKQTGEEVVVLDVSRRKWSDKQSVQIHTKCLNRLLQIEHDRKAKVAGVYKDSASV